MPRPPIAFLLAATFLVGAGSSADAARHRGNVAVVPVSTDQRVLNKAAWKATRAIVKNLRRQGYRVRLIPARQARKMRICLQQASCVEAVGSRMGVRYFVAAFAQRLGRSVHVDMRVISAKNGSVVASRSFDRGGTGGIVGASAAVARALVGEAGRGVKVASASSVRGSDAQFGDAVTRSEAEAAAQIVEVRDEELPDEPSTAPKARKVALAGGSPMALDAATPVVQRETSVSLFSGRYWHAWTAAGAGVAALGAAAVFGVFSRKANREAHDALTQPDAWTLQDEARKNALGANVMFAVGGAALVTSAILFYVEARQERREQRQRLQLGINIAKGGGHLTVKGRF